MFWLITLKFGSNFIPKYHFIFAFIHLQRTSNVENSTYDLYAIPKDSDSKNPDGKMNNFRIPA